MINEDVRHIIETELQDGEELLWAGKPNRALDYYYICMFALSCLGVYLFVTLELRITEPIQQLLGQFPWGAPVFLGVVFLSAIRFWFIKTEIYAVTNKHVFIHSMIPSRHIHKIPFSSVTKVKRSFFSGRDTINLTLKGTDALSSKTPIASVTVGFWTRVVVQLKQVSNPRILLELIYKQMEATS